MSKDKVNVRELVDQYQANCDRIQQIADACEAENRERTAEESKEFELLQRNNSILNMKMNAVQAEGLREKQPVNLDVELRESLNKGQKVVFRLQRDIMTTAGLANTGIIPTKDMDMLKPLRAGLIWDKVGIPVQSGLVGKLRWPKHTQATGAFADEAEQLTDSSISFDKLEMSGVRMGIAIPVTKEELYDSEGVVERVIREEMPSAIIDLINAAMFTTVGTIGTGDSAVAKKVVGPLVEAAKAGNVTTFAGSVPTRKELLTLKAKVVGSGIKVVAPCWTMTEAMKSELEDLKVDAGSGRFVCENDRILGYPVFTTNKIEEGYIAFGDWSYQAAGFFGPMELVVDPYTLARKNAVDFVLNGRFGTVTLRPEAFAVGKSKS